MCMNTDLLWTSCTDLYHTVKTLANKDCRKFGRKNFDELKSICIGNVMEIVKIGKNLAKNTRLAFCGCQFMDLSL